MKQHIESLLQTALKTLQATNEIELPPAFVQVEATRDKRHGDFASNIALIMAKAMKKKPRDVAELILKSLPKSRYVEKTEIAGPGFINFFLSPQALFEIVPQVLAQKETYGKSKIGREKKVLVEFLSSNPTGPLHVGHGRHAAFGAVIANLLSAVGFKVYCEYYVNDAGRQMDIITTSVWLRYLILCGVHVPLPVNAYQGDYVKIIAEQLFSAHQQAFVVTANELLADLPKDETEGGDKEKYIDACIARAKDLLKDKFEIIFNFTLKSILDDIKNDLAEFGVHYDSWFSERELVKNGTIDTLLAKLDSSGYVYEKEGAKWFRSTHFGDEKDRVLVRSNGTRTYFANDVAYHLSKFDRGFDLAIDIFGSDHHGYVPRMKAAMEASAINPERLMHLLVQFVSLYRQGKQVQMSTRGGNFITLRELRSEVGNDAARFFYVMRKYEQHMDFDLDLAKSQSNDNPMYYVQYAYARICSVFKQLAEKKIAYDEGCGLSHLALLIAPEERQLLNTITRYPDIIRDAALNYEPHQVTHYLREIATDFHAYYNSQQFIVEDNNLRDARLALISATRQVLLNGFNILGISAPESM